MHDQPSRAGRLRGPLLEVCGLLGRGWGRGAAGVIELLAGEPECVLKEMLSERQGWPIGQADTASGR